MTKTVKSKLKISSHPCVYLTPSEIKAGGYTSIKEAAQAGWSNEQLIYYYIRTGDLPHVRDQSGKLVVSESDLRGFFGEKSHGLPQKAISSSCYIYQDSKPVGLKLGALKIRQRAEEAENKKPTKRVKKSAANKSKKHRAAVARASSAQQATETPKRGFFARLFGI